MPTSLGRGTWGPHEGTNVRTIVEAIGGLDY